MTSAALNQGGGEARSTIPSEDEDALRLTPTRATLATRITPDGGGISGSINIPTEDDTTLPDTISQENDLTPRPSDVGAVQYTRRASDGEGGAMERIPTGDDNTRPESLPTRNGNVIPRLQTKGRAQRDTSVRGQDRSSITHGDEATPHRVTRSSTRAASDIPTRDEDDSITGPPVSNADAPAPSHRTQPVTTGAHPNRSRKHPSVMDESRGNESTLCEQVNSRQRGASSHTHRDLSGIYVQRATQGLASEPVTRAHMTTRAQRRKQLDNSTVPPSQSDVTPPPHGTKCPKTNHRSEKIHATMRAQQRYHQFRCPYNTINLHPCRTCDMRDELLLTGAPVQFITTL